MTYPSGLDIIRGRASGVLAIHKYGHNHAVGALYEPVCVGGLYRTPQVGSETAVRVKAGGSADDAAAGVGAREITVYGIDVNGALAEEALATNGTLVSNATTQKFLRIFKAKVTKTGTYATQAASSHGADIIIEDAAGTEDWLTVPFEDGFGYSRSQIGVYTIPANKRGYLAQIQIDVDSNKEVDLLLFKRNNILETEAPYSPMEVIQEFPALTGNANIPFIVPLGDLGPATDIGFLAKAAQTSAITVKFIIICVEGS